jgi:ubiquinone/menaquinone biosynthesis C-methylase UbiE
MEDFDIIAHYYDLFYLDFAEDVPMYLGFAERCGSPLLELACGTGRVLLSLARAGYEITGLDVSPAMLDVARAKVEAERLSGRARLVQSDMRDFSLGRQYNLAYVPLNSFMHLVTPEDHLAALSCIRRHLAPDGLLIIDMFNPDQDILLSGDGRVTLEKTLTDPHTGVTVQWFHSRRVDTARQIQEVTFIIDEIGPDGAVRRVLFPFTMRYFFRPEKALLLEKAGFVVENVYGSYDLDPFGPDSEKMIFVARLAPAE